MDDDIINSKPTVNQMLNAQFIQISPLSFRQKGNDNEGNDTKENKKNKLNQDDSRLVKNSGRIPDWMSITGGGYQKHFSGKDIEIRSRFKGNPMMVKECDDCF